VLSVAVSHDGQRVVSGSRDCNVRFWDAKGAGVQCILRGHQDWGMYCLTGSRVPTFFVDSRLVFSIDLSPAGNVLATGSFDGKARICMCLLICRMILDVLIVF